MDGKAMMTKTKKTRSKQGKYLSEFHYVHG